MLAIHDTAWGTGADPGLHKSARVLVVESDEAARHALASILASEGYVVKSARDGVHALEIATVFAPDVVLTGLRMSGMDGLELCAWLHVRRPTLPVLVMRDSCEMQSTVRGLRAGAAEYLTKPLDTDVLLSRLRRTVAVRATAVERAHEDVLSIVSHDLRTPLSVIQSAVPLLLESAADASDQATIRRSAAMITRATARMSRMIEDLIDHTRIETGKLQLDRARFSLADILGDVADLVPLAEAKQIRLDIVPPRESATTFCDRARLGQVLFNLVSNAIKCSSSDTTITVSAERIDGIAFFTVRDQGHGMSAATLARIFERFWQPVGSARSGLGLGLYIAKAIIEAHGGSLSVESTLGQGSSFTCSIPDAISEQDGDGRT